MSEGSGWLLRQLSDQIVELAERVVPSTAIARGQTADFEDGGGSACLIDAEHLVTNNHVVNDLVEPIEVQLPGTATTEARVIGRDPLTDLAVLRIDQQPVSPCTSLRRAHDLDSSVLPSAAHSASSPRASAWAS
jgi:S1-C subfamily serine protease